MRANMNQLSRRRFIGGVAAIGAAAYGLGGVARAEAISGGTLDPTTVPKYAQALVIPPVMPMTGKKKNADYYEIAVREFDQQILPPGMPMTTVWSYGSVDYPGSVFEGGSFFYPALTIEAKYNKPVRVKWINDLVDENGNYLPHLLPVDQTLHWANPPGGLAQRDKRGYEQEPYVGPVPMITHVHGAHVTQESDGYPEAWYLPDANNIPAGFAKTGTFYDEYKNNGVEPWGDGFAVFQYPNDQRATTLWYHDHSLGMTRLNVYAGPAGFYLIRGGPDDVVSGVLPGPAPKAKDKGGEKYFEIPIAIQDRSFNADGSLFYPDNRAFFEGLDPNQLKIPFIPEDSCEGPSDVSPIWNPEFFGNTMVVNGRTWPYLEVERRRYRFRLLNGCNSRFLILRMDNDMPFYQIGSEGGFLPSTVMLPELLMAPAERADVIVDFTDIPEGTNITLLNFGPDEPFGGGTPGVDFDASDPQTTGQVMQFKVVARAGTDESSPPLTLGFPSIVSLTPTLTRKLSLNEEESATVRFKDNRGKIMEHCGKWGEVFGPTSALLGVVDGSGYREPLLWMDPITENPAVGSAEEWEIYNFTADAHPIHVHLVMFQVLNRQALVTDEEGMTTEPATLSGPVRPPEAWEFGWKDTVISYPGEVTRIKARFDIAGLYVWHCHIVEHEDNEMMRPYHVVPIPPP